MSLSFFPFFQKKEAQLFFFFYNFFNVLIYWLLWVFVLWLTGFRFEGSVVVAYRISCSTACGISLDQEWNLSQWNLSFGLLLWLSKESPCNVGDLGLTPGLGRCPGERKGYPLQYSWAFLVAQLVKNLPAVWETWVWPLGWEDPLEKGKVTHSSILA